jgi:hypothetical protein
MNYESWRISFQSSESAARAAFNEWQAARQSSQSEPVAWANKDLTLVTTVKALDGSMRNKGCGFGNEGIPLFAAPQQLAKENSNFSWELVRLALNSMLEHHDRASGSYPQDEEQNTNLSNAISRTLKAVDFYSSWLKLPVPAYAQTQGQSNPQYEQVLQFATDQEARHILAHVNNDIHPNEISLAKKALQEIYSKSEPLYRKVDIASPIAVDPDAERK